MTRSWRDTLRLSASWRPHRHHSAADNLGWILVRRTPVSHVGSQRKCQQFHRRVLLRGCASVTKVRVWQLEVFERFSGVSERSRRRPDSHTAQGYRLYSDSHVLFTSHLKILQYFPFHITTLIWRHSFFFFFQNTDQKMILQRHVFIIFSI